MTRSPQSQPLRHWVDTSVPSKGGHRQRQAAQHPAFSLSLGSLSAPRGHIPGRYTATAVVEARTTMPVMRQSGYRMRGKPAEQRLVICLVTARLPAWWQRGESAEGLGKRNEEGRKRAATAASSSMSQEHVARGHDAHRQPASFAKGWQEELHSHRALPILLKSWAAPEPSPVK
jgi:hypothetical protein